MNQQMQVPERNMIYLVRKVLSDTDIIMNASITRAGVPSVCLINCLYLHVIPMYVLFSFKKQLDSYLSTVPDSPCLPGFNNSLDHGDYQSK